MSWRIIRPFVALAFVAPGLMTCGPKQAPLPVYPHPERLSWAEVVDWEAMQDEAVELLSGYLRVNTANPPGNEARGVDFLQAVLEAEGIPTSRHAFAPGRENLIARLDAEDPQDKPLCLLHHIDVTTAEDEHWEEDPFSGLVDDDGVIWGRGALDMKSTGVLGMMSMALLKRQGVPLRRDVILLAVGDEEVHNAGAAWIADHYWDELDCGHVFNEGGIGVQGALVDDLTTFTVSFTEKGALWLRMVAQGEPGHGSTPLPDSAPARLMEALERLEERKEQPTWHPEVFNLLHAVGEKAGGLTGAVLRSPGLTKAFAKGQLMEHPLSRAILTNTINVTGFGGAEEPNVVPSEVWAQLDIRMLPGVTKEHMFAELDELLEGVEGISFEVLEYSPAAVSPTDDPVYKAIVRNLQAAFPEAAVGPLIMMGTTDSGLLRPKGAHCYGIAPFEFTQDELRGMHGHNERIGSDNLGRGLEVMYRIVLDVAAGDPVESAP